MPPPADALTGGTVLALASPADDLAVLAERAARHDATCVVRLVAAGGVVAAFVPTPFGCLGLRAVRLRVPAQADVVVEAVGLAARAWTGGTDLHLPPALPALLWTHPLPPRAGWTVAGTLTVADVAARVEADTQEFQRRAAQVAPGPAAAAAVEGVARELWSRPLAADHVAGLAHAAVYLGFVPEPRSDRQPGSESAPAADSDDPVTLRTAGVWRRLDSPLGVTLARASDPLGLLVG